MRLFYNNFLTKYLFTIFVIVFFIPKVILSQSTYVPDDNFENYLEANGMGDGIPLNDYVTTSNISSVTNLQLFFLSITDLTGIEDFVSLTNLNTEGNSNLTSVDISQNTALVDARFNQCDLNSLDVSNNPLLSILTFGGNNVSSIDLSNNPLLTNLDCWNNSLTALDLSQNTALTSINCNSNQIASLDFSNNPNMINISCNSNQLTSLDVTSLSSLQILWCPGNTISVLDLSQNSQLNTIHCENNTLHRLDVKNGNNINVTQFFTTGNPSLECINVDDSTYSANNWTNIDSQQYFGESCYCSLIINSQTNVSCYGGYDGSLILTGTGGTGYYNYVLGFLNQFTGTLIPFTNTGTGFYATPINLTNVPANCYTATITDSLGCADTTTICVTQPDSIYSITTMTQCNLVVWNFNTYNSSGIYNAVLTAANGCDSSAILDVTLIYSDSSFSTITACDSYVWNGTTYTSSGTYTNTSLGSNGCDSIAVLYLTINNSSTYTFSAISCDSYDWDGTTYTTTGQFTNLYSDQNGCDSSVTLDLTINNSSINTVSVTSCDNYVWDGVTYTTSGQFTNLYSDQNGCDSSVTLDLTINNSSTNTVAVNSCDSYDWDGVTYSLSGQYINVYTALSGCDSTVTLDLTLSYSDTSFINISACDSFTLNNISYNQSGLYYQTLSADSLSGFNYVGTYNGSTYYISENPEYWGLAQSNCIANGGNLVCISDANENDFVSNILPGQQFWLGYTDETVEGSFVWVDGSTHSYTKWSPTEPSNSGPTGNEDYTLINSGEGGSNPLDGFWNDVDDNLSQYLYVLELPYSHLTSNGCDSVIALNLTINVSDTSYTNITACDSVEWNGEWYDSSGTYYSNNVSNNNYSMNFDGNNDYVLSNLYNNFNNQMSVGLWFKSNQLGQDSKLLYTGSWTNSGTRNFNIKLTNNGIIFILSIQGNNQFFVETGNNYIVDTLWHNIFATYDDNYIKLYIDGLIFDSVNVVGNINNVNDLYFGTRNPLGEYFDGSLDEVQLWDKALNHIEIQSYMSCPPLGNETNLVGYWNFEEGSGNTVYDLTSNGNDGTINGASYDTNVPYQTCQLTNSSGCDSVAVLNLTINQSDTSFTNITACDSVEWNGTWYDSSGTYYSNTTVSNNNYSMSFDGIDDFISCQNNITGNYSEFSIEGWINVNNFPNVNSGKIVDIGGPNSRFIVETKPNQTLHFEISENNILQDGLASVVGLQSNEWIHFAAVWDSDQYVKLFINGNEASSNVIPPNLTSINISSQAGIFFGARYSNSDFFDGLIDRLSIWGKALDEIEIQNFMNCPPNGSENELYGLWNFEEGSGNTVYDLTSNGNDGTINGASYDTNVPIQSCQLTNLNGCDSVSVLNLNINNSVYVYDTTTICNGDSALVGGSIYTSSGNYIDTLITNTGCDSIINTILEVINVNINQNDTAICLGDSIVLSVNSSFSNYSDTNTQSLQFNYGQYATIPNNGSLLNDTTYTIEFWYKETGFSGGDEHIFGNDWFSSKIYFSRGGGDVNFLRGNNLSTTNIQNQWNHYAGVRDGDSVYFFIDGFLVDSEVYNNSNSTSLTDFTVNHHTWNSGSSSRLSGFFDELRISNIARYTSSFNPPSYEFVTDSNTLYLLHFNGNIVDEMNNNGTLNGASFSSDVPFSSFTQITSNNNTYLWSTGDTNLSITVAPSQTTTYYITQIQNGISCTDSITITVLDTSITNMNVTACDSFAWDGATYTSTGLYTNIYPNVNGCDSTVTLDLTINNSSSNTVTVTACDSFDWDGVTYTTTGLYTNIYSDINGCDSIVSLDLIINNSSTNTVSIISCDSYDWDGVTYTSTGLYTNLYTDVYGCDSTVTLDLTINYSSTNSIIVTACNSFDWDGVTYTTSGQYTNLYADINGCDSTVTLDLTINYSSTNTVTITSCDSFDWDGVTYTTSGQYTNLYADINGCDSTVTLDLTINNSSTNTVTITSCDSFDWDGVTYTTTGLYTNIYSDINGCDSTVTLDLTINYSSTNTVTITSCDSFDWDGVTYTVSGQYTNLYTDINGCDSSVTLDLTINNSSTNTVNITSCDSFDWDGVTYNLTGQYTNLYTDTNGCDSTVTLDLTIVNTLLINQNDTSICLGDSITLSISGSNFNACVLPSNLQTNLTGFYPFCGNADDESSFSNNGSVNGAVLSNDRFNNSNSAYDFDGSNDYIDLGSPSANSGSLTISSWVKTTNVVNGQRWIVSRSSWTTGAWQLMTYNGYAASEFDWGGQLVGNTFIADGQWHHVLTIYDASTNYRYLYVDGVQDGIDMTRGPFNENGNQMMIGKRPGSGNTFNGSIDDVVLYNRVLSTSEIQDLYNSSSNNILWSTGDSSSTITVSPTQTTSYWLETTENGFSCRDSVVITVLDTSLTSFSITSCDSYDWDGVTYTSTGQYTNLYTNVNGCDSTVTLNLTINNSSTSTVTITACDSFTWDGVTYTTTGQYTNVYSDVNGCDSTVTLDLTINNSSTSSFNITACDSFDWDGVTYTVSGQYTNLYTDINGCDSTVTLDLTINNSSSYTVAVTACDSYDWDGVTYSTSGQYTNLYTDMNGCDSTVTLDLTINNSFTSSFNITACDSYDWDGVTYTSTGLYTNIYTGMNGCDSTVTLFLNIINSTVNYLTVTECDSYTWDGVTYTSTGLYSNTYTALNGCDSIVTLDLIIISSPVIVQSDTTICYGDSITLETDLSFQISNSQDVCLLSEISSNLQNDLVAYYPFCGNANDISLNSNNGNVIGANLSTNRFGDSLNSYVFDGVGDYIELVNSTSFSSLDSNISISSWIYPENYNDGTIIDRDICGNSPDWHLSWRGNGNAARVLLRVNNQSLYSGNYTSNQWLHIVAVKNNTNFELYINNQFQGSVPVPINLINTSLPIYIGDQVCNSSSEPNFDGRIDDVGVWSRALDSSEVNQLYNSNFPQYVWSTGDSAATITIVPTQTTTYILEKIDNGISCFDSVTVTVNDTSSSFYQAVSCDNYTWNGITYSTSGLYSFTSTNYVGCDSIAFLDLTINNEYDIIDSIGICPGDSILITGNYYSTLGTYVDSFFTNNGCDSIVTTVLSYLPIGCTDSTSFNYDPLAQCDDNSCIMAIYGCLDSNAINYYPSANFDDGSCIYLGCTDSTASNYNPAASIDDGSCVYAFCSDPVPFGFFTNDITDTKARINWNNMNDSACMVWKYFVRYREVGTNTWTTKSAGVGSGLCNVGLNTTSKVLQNLNPSTTYEYKMKAFYCGGTESSYSSPVQFTTEDLCPEMTNLSAQTFYFNPNKVRFNWDTTGLYTFARIVLRVDTIGSSWQGAGGYGIYYPNLSVNKYGMQPGEFYRAQGRTFCDSNITSYRSWWTPPIFWQQPGSSRLNGGNTISNLDVYPNPSRDIFNISFVSEELQNLKFRILNILGEEIYTEEKEQYIGEYTKQINLNEYRKGVYFLEIETNGGIINKKLILQ